MNFLGKLLVQRRVFGLADSHVNRAPAFTCENLEGSRSKNNLE
jgi:hypothetical protein